MSGIVGRWHITETDLWGEDDLALVGRPEIVFSRRGEGFIRVGALQAELDYRIDKNAQPVKVEFTWAGVDDMDPVSGRGWVEINGASMTGKLFIHLGDEVTFKAAQEGSMGKGTRKTNG
jgi:hypothetical protein